MYIQWSLAITFRITYDIVRRTSSLIGNNNNIYILYIYILYYILYIIEFIICNVTSDLVRSILIWFSDLVCNVNSTIYKSLFKLTLRTRSPILTRLLVYL